MKKVLFLFAVLNIMFSSFMQSKAQSISQPGSGVELSLGVNVGLPLGDFGTGWNPGIAQQLNSLSTLMK